MSWKILEGSAKCVRVVTGSKPENVSYEDGATTVCTNYAVDICVCILFVVCKKIRNACSAARATELRVR